MADGGKKQRSELDKLQSELGPYYHQALVPRRRAAGGIRIEDDSGSGEESTGGSHGGRGKGKARARPVAKGKEKAPLVAADDTGGTPKGKGKEKAPPIARDSGSTSPKGKGKQAAVQDKGKSEDSAFPITRDTGGSPKARGKYPGIQPKGTEEAIDSTGGTRNRPTAAVRDTKGRAIALPYQKARGKMSQRNRSGRGSSRNNGNNTHGEEAQIWESCKTQLAEIVTSVNADNDNLNKLVDMDKKAGTVDPAKVPTELIKQMEQMCRKGVKFSDANVSSMKNVYEQLKVMRAVIVAKEQSEGPSKRAAAAAAAAATAAASTRDSAAAASLYDFDGGGDSPVPSPMGGGSSSGAGAAGGGGASRKHGDRSSNRDRDSMPPKADSAEPQQGSGSGAGAGAAGTGGPGSGGSNSGNRGRVVFSKGDAVAFKPKAASGEASSDWILGEVAQVLGEGKSRRYKVLDIEPEDQSKQKEYRSSASSMIAITPESQAGSLRDWEAGKVVLALYPNTTTFYKAEVHSMDGDGRVNLKFEGENDSTTLQQVERRFVIEYRA